MSNSKQPHGSILTLGASRKRKEREIGIGGGGGGGFDAFALKASKNAMTPTMARNHHNYMSSNKAEPKLQLQQQQQQPKTNEDNRLLAGFLAHEFLTKGTLLGQKWDPARAEAIPISPRRPNLRKVGGAGNSMVNKSTAVAELVKPMKKHESYAEVANLLKCDGVHLEGIVNPTQLARWFKM